MLIDHRRFITPVIAGIAAACCGLLAACSGGGLGSLTGGPSDIDRTFLLAAGNWDRNKDGVVSCEEWKAYAGELFNIGDSGRKGFVAKEDWAAIVKVDRMFETVDFSYYDRNSDGKIERAELVDRQSRVFELADRDKNCQLTTVELSGARSAGTVAAQAKVGPPPETSTNPTRR